MLEWLKRAGKPQVSPDTVVSLQDPGSAPPPVMPSVASVPWYMDLGARGKPVWRDCPADIRDEVNFFLDHGYVVLRNCIEPDLIARARQELDAHRARHAEAYARHADANGLQRRLVNWHLLMDAFKYIYSRNSRALKIQDFLFQAESTCYTSLVFEAGTEQDIHRDSPYFCTNPEYYYLGVWVALERVDERSGALCVFDGGHMVHEPDRFALYRSVYPNDEAMQPNDPRLWTTYQNRVTEMCEARGLPRVTVPMEPGDTLIWHPHLPHGGSPILDAARSRFSIVNHVAPVGVPVAGIDVFYGRKSPPSVPEFPYFEFDGRKFTKHTFVDFAHKELVPAEDFRL